MISILAFQIVSPLRVVAMFIDGIAFSFIDQAYNLITTFASADFGTLNDTISTIRHNIYYLVSIIAFFRMAVSLVNSLINPDKLNDKEEGFGKVLTNFVIMIIILVMTPLAFDLLTGNGLYEDYSSGTQLKSVSLSNGSNGNSNIQKLIVEQGYITSLFSNAGIVQNGTNNPGKVIQNTVVSSLITIDTNFCVHDSAGNCYYKDTAPNGTNCNGTAGPYMICQSDACYKGTKKNNCPDAVNSYSSMQNMGEFSFATLAKYAGEYETVTVNGQDADVYVYNSPFPFTFAIGVFITYLLLSFAIDIAVRLVELMVLEMVSPIFIVTYIDPKSAKSGPFHNWLKTFGKTYVSLFLRLGAFSIMLLLISALSQGHVLSSVSGLAKILFIVAILIFAKKAPDWFGKMIGVEGKLGDGLNIGKKLGGAALIGGTLSKGVDQAKKIGKGARSGLLKGAAGAAGGFISKKGSLSDKLKSGKQGMFSGMITGTRAGYNGNTKGLITGGWKTASKAAKGGRQSIFDQAGAKIRAVGEAVEGQSIDSLVVARANQVDALKKKLIGIYGSGEANRLLKQFNAGKAIDFLNASDFNKYTKYLKTLVKGEVANASLSDEPVNVTPDMSKADPLKVQENIHNRRQELFDTISQIAQQKSYDPAHEGEYNEQMKKLIKDNASIFTENGGTSLSLGIEDISTDMGINPRGPDGPEVDLKVFLPNLTEQSKKNSKALAATQKDISDRDEVKKENGDKK